MAALDAGCGRISRAHQYTQVLAKGRASYEKGFTLFLSFLSFLSLLLPSTSLLSSSHQLTTINYHPHPRIIQTLCLHLSHSTPLRYVKPSPLIITSTSNTVFSTVYSRSPRRISRQHLPELSPPTKLTSYYITKALSKRGGRKEKKKPPLNLSFT